MLAATDLSGFWVGTIVQGVNTSRVFVNLSVSGNAVTGSYEVPTAPSVYRTGSFEGTIYEDSITLTLSQEDPHGPLQFNLRVVQNDSEYMLLGYTVSGGNYPRFAGVTLFRFEPSSSFRSIPGIWP